MSQYQMSRIIRSELVSLNEKIDEKILKGMSYAREARRHKFLLSRLYDLKRRSENSWFSRSFGLVSTLMF